MSVEFENYGGNILDVYKNEDVICDLCQDNNGHYVLEEFYDYYPKLTSSELRQIADKLDELNNAK
jgi:hypothetical protein